MNKIIGFIILGILIISSGYSVSAQDMPSNDPVYIVQPGDYLSTIAARFAVSVEELIAANDLANPNNIKAGDRLIIPGLQGISGVLTTEPVPFGSTLTSLVRYYQLPLQSLIRLNHITSPGEMYAGANLVVTLPDPEKILPGKLSVRAGQTLLEIAAISGENPWKMMQQNHLSGNWSVLTGDTLFYKQSDKENSNPTLFSPDFVELELAPLPLIQGKTSEYIVNTQLPTTWSGTFADYPLNFHPTQDTTSIALQGVHAMMPPGIYPVHLTGISDSGDHFEFTQMVLVAPGGYGNEYLHNIDPTTLDPAITEPENELIQKTAASITPERYWKQQFVSPGTYLQFTSVFGTRRSYNDGPLDYFHTGVDFAGGIGLPIYAPAEGKVVFTETLTVRGNATMIDHGWGVYSGFWHQSEIKVKVGDYVEQGQIIGLVGNTGRVQGADAYTGAGAHLHWELWVNGVQVDPLEWLSTTYP